MKRVISWSYVAVVFYVTRWNYHFLRATGSARGFPELPPLAFWLLLFTAMLIPVVPHEAGHWVAGVAAGWRGMRFRIGPYALVRAARGWKIRWIKWDLGGAVTFSPLGLAGFGKADALLTVGGPVASVLFGAACGWIAWQAKTAAVLGFSESLRNFRCWAFSNCYLEVVAW